MQGYKAIFLGLAAAAAANMSPAEAVAQNTGYTEASPETLQEDYTGEELIQMANDYAELVAGIISADNPRTAAVESVDEIDVRARSLISALQNTVDGFSPAQKQMFDSLDAGTAKGLLQNLDSVVAGREHLDAESKDVCDVTRAYASFVNTSQSVSGLLSTPVDIFKVRPTFMVEECKGPAL